MDQGWPPAWSVSFSDLTTLLMTAFVLWYSLSAAKIPAELLVISQKKAITKEDVEYVQRMKTKPAASKQNTVAMLKDITPQQEKAIEEYKKMQEFGKELKQYLNSMQIEDVVEAKEGIEAVMITPRAPLLFKEGKTTLRAEGTGLLDKIIQLLKQVPYYNLRIEGHTDIQLINPFNRWRYPSNWELSYGRAVAIAEYLVKKGVPPERIGVSGYGEEKPRFPNDTEENMAKNRRVDIYIYFAKPA